MVSEPRTRSRGGGRDSRAAASGGPGVAPAEVSNADDLRLKDWAECRATIDRYDKILEDLRKFGFTLVTGLLTASSLLGHSVPSETAIGAAFAAAMVLVTALFLVDTYYQVLLSGAIERALDIEVMTNPYVRVTRTISKNAQRVHVAWLVLALYAALMFAALFLSVVSTAAVGWAAVWPSLVAFAALFPVMLMYWRLAAQQSGFHSEKERHWPEDVGLAPPPKPTPLSILADRVVGPVQTR